MDAEGRLKIAMIAIHFMTERVPVSVSMNVYGKLIIILTQV